MEIHHKGTSKIRHERADMVLRSARVRKYAEHRKHQSGACSRFFEVPVTETRINQHLPVEELKNGMPDSGTNPIPARWICNFSAKEMQNIWQHGQFAKA